jgi:hypothetical protein
VFAVSVGVREILAHSVDHERLLRTRGRGTRAEVALKKRAASSFSSFKQRLGWEECRAWTRNPIERTTQMMFATLTALRLLEMKAQEQQGDDWWLQPPWNPNKSRPSVLDVQRLLWQYRDGIQQCLADWLGSEGKAGE